MLDVNISASGFTEACHESTTFLESLWGNRAPDGGKILIWVFKRARGDEKEIKLSRWFRVFRNMEKTIAEHPGYDAYAGMSMASESFQVRAHRRVGNKSAAAIPGLWADIDLKSDDPAVHQKDGLPEDLAEVMDELDQLPLMPTMLISSGNGLQAYWLLTEPWVFASDDERDQAAELSHNWQRIIMHRWKRHEWTMDATHDLARVMRLPGSLNYKTDPPKPVSISHMDGPRYTLEEIEQTVSRYLETNPEAATLAPTPPARKKASEKGASGKGSGRKTGASQTQNPSGVVIKSGAMPPEDKLSMLLEMSARFKRSWEMHRQDMKGKSASEYDYSMASIAIEYGWDDQEVADLLVAWRTRHGLEIKRDDYFIYTINKIRDQQEDDDQQHLLEETLSAGKKTDSAEPPEPPGVLKNLSNLFGVRVYRILRYLGEDNTFVMETELGNVVLGEVKNIFSQAAFRQKLAAVTKKLIPRCKTSEWEHRVNAILRASDDIDIGEASDPTAETRDWISQYMASRVPAADRDAAAARQDPFVREGRVHIFMPALRKDIEYQSGEKVGSTKMGRRLKQYGATPARVPVKIDGRQTTRSTWALPLDEFKPPRESRDGENL